ncbi:MAG: Stp1/IreP family PP2C-type Ser/Thr phosphatase [Eggerthellaceae bacterium]|nr:Stp1/IreP family PP2C-type Ser/Thr phosphatase [Eggerthellaceae bacterium]
MPSRPRVNSNRRQNSFGSRTDIGCVREHNEDSLIVAPPLYAVADGMGGHAAGEVASEIAVRTLADMGLTSADTMDLANAVIEANHAVITAARKKGRAGMGTTLTAAVIEGERLAIAQVGDSRAYLLHQGVMQQLTRDHSLMADMIEAGQITEEEARVHPKRSVITRALGSDPGMQPDLYELNVAAGDRLLLCSDGLSTMLEDDQIENILIRTRDPQRAASILVNEAIAAGGHDNITVIVLDIEGNAERETRKTVRKSRWGAVLVALLVAAVVAAIGYGAYTYTQSTAYLTAENGKVVIYQGVPDSVLGIELSHLNRVTDVSTSQLQPGIAKRLEEGIIRVDSLEAAEALVEEYQEEIAEEAKSDSSASADSSASGNASGSAGTSGSGNSANAAGPSATDSTANASGGTT